MNVLVLYHGAYLPSSHELFSSLGRRCRLRVLAPHHGYNRLRGVPMEIRPRHEEFYDLCTGRIFRARKDFTGPYLTGLFREFLQRPDIVHVFNEPYATVHLQCLLLRAVARPSAKCLAMGVENLWGPPGSRRIAIRRAFAHTHTDAVTCWSQGADSLAACGFPADKLAVTHWGLPIPVRPAGIPAGTRSGAFRVGFVGRIAQEKGLWTLLLAMKQLPHDVECLCIGGGPWESEFRRKIHHFGLEGRVTVVPRVDEDRIPEYLAGMDALVLPSESTPGWTEQFGRVLIEAMGCGVPVIGSSSGAIPEVIGEAGLIFEERDCSKLASAIERIKTDREFAESLALAGRQRAEEVFGCDAFAERLVALYERVLSSSPPRPGGVEGSGR